MVLEPLNFNLKKMVVGGFLVLPEPLKADDAVLCWVGDDESGPADNG